MGIFYRLYKKNLVKEVAQVYIKEVFIKYKTLNKIILNKDTKFILVY